jgi:thioredoxin-dependent peroxiredoxin
MDSVGRGHYNRLRQRDPNDNGSRATEVEMRLKVGTRAPVFAAQTVGGRLVDLSALRGRTVLLKFYRFATCPVCNLHLREFIQDYRRLEALGLTTVVLFHSPADKLAASQSEATPFDLIPDPDKRIFRAFGVETGWTGMFSPAVMRDYMRALLAGFPPGLLTSDGGITGNPADFIVDADGRIAFAHYGRHYADSLGAAEIADIRRGLEVDTLQPETEIPMFQRA